MAIRQSLVTQFDQGISISRIAANFNISRGTVYSILKRYKSEGKDGLKPLYANCGKARPDSEALIFRAVRCMKTWHPGWGAEKIHAELLLLRPNLSLPHPRTFYRWFRWNGQTVPSSKLPKSVSQWSEKVHEGWQIDAKEEILIADGSKKCWLNITDEKSGTVISPAVFSPEED
jgi:hypothetical protein